MKMKSFLAFLFAAFLLAGTASARSLVEVVDHENVPVSTSSGHLANAEQVKQSIIAAASSRQWEIKQLPSGNLLASLQVRGKHAVVVEIACSDKNYSIRYKDSTNMRFETDDKQRMIHPNYNKWVSALREAIRFEIQKL